LAHGCLSISCKVCLDVAAGTSVQVTAPMSRNFAFPAPGFGVLVALLVGIVTLTLAAQDAPSGIGRPVPAVVFRDAEGARIALQDLRDARAIIVAFLALDCPVSNAGSATLAALAKDYAMRGVRVIGVVPGVSDPAEATRGAQTLELPFPVYPDGDFAIADALS